MLRCIFYAEFDNTEGPRMVYQAPKGHLSSQRFDEISGYIITGPKLSHKIVDINACGHRILGYPIRIENSKYDRNAFLFNIGFMFKVPESAESGALDGKSIPTPTTPPSSNPQDRWAPDTPPPPSRSTAASPTREGEKRRSDLGRDGKGFNISSTPLPLQLAQQRRPSSASLSTLQSAATSTVWSNRVRQYEPVLRKLAGTIETLEHEVSFLSNPKSRERLSEVLPSILANLNDYGQCIVSLHRTSVLSLKIFPRLSPPGSVKNHQVPVQIIDIHAVMTARWDITLRQVVPYIDGVRYVAKIAEDAGVDIKLVRECLRQLLYYKCIRMMDIFQFTNLYACTTGVTALWRDPKLQNECVSYVLTRAPQSGTASASLWATVFRLYAALDASLGIGRFCINAKLSRHGVDVRRFVTFGLIYGLIRRIHRYPTMTRAKGLQPLKKKQQAYHSNYGIAKGDPTNMVHFFDGKHSFDELCVKFRTPYQFVSELCKKNKNRVVVIMR